MEWVDVRKPTRTSKDLQTQKRTFARTECGRKSAVTVTPLDFVTSDNVSLGTQAV